MHDPSADALAAHPQGRGSVAKPSASRTDAVVSKIRFTAPTCRLLRCALAVTVLLACAAPLGAATLTTSTSPVSFDDPAVWNPGVPGATDIASFVDSGGTSLATYTVTFPSSVANQQAVLTDVDVTFDLGGSTYTLTSLSSNDPSLLLGLASPFGPDTVSTLTLVNSGTPAAVDVSAVDVVIGMQAGDTGTLNVNDTTLSASGDLSAGFQGSGTLNISGGGEVISDVGYIGENFGSAGNVSVDGATPDLLPSTLFISDRLYVGFAGDATLDVTGGASVWSDRSFIGFGNSSDGSVTVDGFSTLGNELAELSRLRSNELYVGGEDSASGGTGSLAVSNGAAVTIDERLEVWETGTVGVTSGGTLTIDTDPTGPTTEVVRINGGALAVDGGDSSFSSGRAPVFIGGGTAATLSITGGGSATTDNTFLGGVTAGGNGTATVDGNGSQWDVGFLEVGGELPGDGTGVLTVSDSGLVDVAGTLSVRDQGTVNLQSLGTIRVDDFDAGAGTFNFSDGTLTVNGGVYNDGQSNLSINGADASANPTLELVGGKASVSGEAIIGDNAPGTLLISGGGSLTSNLGRVGAEDGGVGSVTVDGSGSTWTNNDDLLVGLFGNGTMHVTGGADVVNRDGFIGFAAGTSGDVTVSGGGSTWTNQDSLYVGGNELASGGTGQLTITGNGRVDVTDSLVVFGTGTVDATGGYVLAEDFNIQGGGSLASDDGWIGLDGIGPAAAYAHTSALVNGDGSMWMIADELHVGDVGTGTLSISGGGDVTNVDGFVGISPVGNGSVSVQDSGSTWVNQNELTIGDFGTGMLDISAGGTVSSATAEIGLNGGAATVTVSGAGSTWTTDSLYLGGDATSGDGTGTVNITSGGSLEVTGTLKIWPGGTINANGGTINAVSIDQTDGGVLDITGGVLSMQTFMGDLDIQGGTLAPGNSPGTTTVTGNYSQDALSTLAIEIDGLVAGTGFDQLIVGGTATLDGLLDVSLLTYAPSVGDFFDIILADTIFGDFASINLPLLGGDLFWQTETITDPLGSDIYRLTAVPEPSSVFLFISGVVGVVGYARSRKRKSRVTRSPTVQREIIQPRGSI